MKKPFRRYGVVSLGLRIATVALAVAAGMGTGGFAQAGEGKSMPVIVDKTLVAWVRLADTAQRGGSALTLDDMGTRFDGIVFGEIAPGKWMAGSDGFQRTSKHQDADPAEMAGPETAVQIAIVYEGHKVSVFRNGEPYAHHIIGSAQTFGPGSVAVMGLRHLVSTDRACLAGAIEDARIYAAPLTVEQIAALRPHEASEPQPLAWWSFRDGNINDRMGAFPCTLLMGKAQVVDGALRLDGNRSYLVAAPQDLSAQWLTAPASGGELLQAVRKHRENLLADPQRPAYHFVAPEGYCMPFDPNGAIFWKGKYHLCYIIQDERGHCWGHASSTDLVHWRFHTPALFPAPGDPDQGIFSGNAFVNLQGEAVMLYHGVGVGNCIATCAEDDLDHWTKLPSNPIVPSPKEGDPEFGKYSSWDPHGWVEDDRYYAIFGGNPPTLFKSIDMVKWDFLHKFLAQDLPGIDADEDISCPDFFPIGDKHMLLCISHKRGCRYYLGRWENEVFYPETHARMNWPGGTCFAPESLIDGQGRRIMWAWVLDRRPADEAQRIGWSGTMCLPRHLWLGEDGALRMAPVAELESLRMNHRQMANLTVEADTEPLLREIGGDCIELALEIAPQDAKSVGIKVRRSPDGEEETVIAYDAEAKQLRVDVVKSSLDKRIKYYTCCMYGGENPEVTDQAAPFELRGGEPLQLRVFIDHSIIEVFANERQCVTQHIYPTREDSLGITLFAKGGEAKVTSIDAWDMAPANPW